MHSIRNFSRSKDGSVAVLFALTVTMLMGVAGGAVDFARAWSAKSRLQAVADQAAMNAATSDQGEPTAIAASLFQEFYGGSVTPHVQASAGSVRVTATERIETALLNVLGLPQLDVTVTAEAGIGQAAAGPQCILLLEPTETALYVNSDSRLDADCGAQVNSSHGTEAVLANSDSHIKVTSLRVVGRTRTNSGSSVTPAPIDNASAQADPMKGLAEPFEATGSCTHMDVTVNNAQHAVLGPGVYCGNLVVNSGGSVSLTPGIYVFRGGLLLNSNSELTATGVTLFFDNGGYLNVNSDSTFDATASTSGTYAGVLIFQGRAAANASAPPFTVNSDSSTRLEGAVYLPQGTFIVNSLSSSNTKARYTAIIAQKMILNSFGTFTVRSDFDGPTPLPNSLASFRNVKVARLMN